MSDDPLAALAAAAGDRVAVVEAGVSTSFAALNAEVNRLANGLRAMGVRAGERLIWCSPNSRQVLVVMHACRKLGVAAVPMAYRLTPAEMEFVITDSGAAVVVAAPEQAAMVAGWAPLLLDTGPGWDALVGSASADEPPPPEGDALGTAMMYTSGTTGRPKGAIRSRTDRALLGAMLGELGFGAGGPEVHLTSGPLYHAGPNAFALITHLFGGTVVVLRAFDPRRWLALVAEQRVTSTFCTPTHLKRVLALPEPELAAFDLSSLRTVICNAAPVPHSLKEHVVARLGGGAWLYEVYGSTELGIDTVLKPEDQLRKRGSCGRPYGGIAIVAVGEDGAVLPAGEVGELFVRTALAIDGYHGAVEPLRELAVDGDGWKSVGDIGYLDDEGFVYICDRKSDLIITGGANVYPAEMEAVLHGHPDVADVAVFGVPDDEWGERVHAVVQPWPGRSVDVVAVEAWAGERLAGYKRPRSWEVREELPRTDSGKLLKRVLRDEHWQGTGRRI